VWVGVGVSVYNNKEKTLTPPTLKLLVHRFFSLFLFCSCELS
jgi:hypothetical protein